MRRYITPPLLLLSSLIIWSCSSQMLDPPPDATGGASGNAGGNGGAGSGGAGGDGAGIRNLGGSSAGGGSLGGTSAGGSGSGGSPVEDAGCVPVYYAPGCDATPICDNGKGGECGGAVCDCTGRVRHTWCNRANVPFISFANPAAPEGSICDEGDGGV